MDNPKTDQTTPCCRAREQLQDIAHDLALGQCVLQHPGEHIADEARAAMWHRLETARETLAQAITCLQKQGL